MRNNFRRLCAALTGITVLMSTHNPLWPKQYPGTKWLFENGEIKV